MERNVNDPEPLNYTLLFLQSLLYRYRKFLSGFPIPRLLEKLEFAPKEVYEFCRKHSNVVMAEFLKKSKPFVVDDSGFVSLQKGYLASSVEDVYAIQVKKIFVFEMNTYRTERAIKKETCSETEFSFNLTFNNLHLKVLELCVDCFSPSNNPLEQPWIINSIDKSPEISSYFNVFTPGDIDTFFGLHSMLFNRDSQNKLVLCRGIEEIRQNLHLKSIVEQICNSLEQEAIKYFVSFLSGGEPCSGFDLLYALVGAPGFVIWHIERNYPTSKFILFFLNHESIFHVDESATVSLVNNESKFSPTSSQAVSNEIKMSRIFCIEKYHRFNVNYCQSEGDAIDEPLPKRPRVENSTQVSVEQEPSFQSVSIKIERNDESIENESNALQQETVPPTEANVEQTTSSDNLASEGSQANPPNLQEIVMTMDAKLLTTFLCIGAIVQAKTEATTFFQNFLYKHKEILPGLPYKAFRRVLAGASSNVLQLCVTLSDDDLLTFFVEQSQHFHVDDSGYVSLHDGFVGSYFAEISQHASDFHSELEEERCPPLNARHVPASSPVSATSRNTFPLTLSKAHIWILRESIRALNDAWNPISFSQLVSVLQRNVEIRFYFNLFRPREICDFFKLHPSLFVFIGEDHIHLRQGHTDLLRNLEHYHTSKGIVDSLERESVHFFVCLLRNKGRSKIVDLYQNVIFAPGHVIHHIVHNYIGKFIMFFANHLDTFCVDQANCVELREDYRDQRNFSSGFQQELFSSLSVFLTLDRMLFIENRVLWSDRNEDDRGYNDDVHPPQTSFVENFFNEGTSVHFDELTCAILHFQSFLTRHRQIVDKFPYESLKKALYSASTKVRRYFTNISNLDFFNFFKMRRGMFYTDSEALSISLNNNLSSTDLSDANTLNEQLNSKFEFFIRASRNQPETSPNTNRQRDSKNVTRFHVRALQESVRIVGNATAPMSCMELRYLKPLARLKCRNRLYFSLLSACDVVDFYKAHSTFFRCDAENMLSLVDGISVSKFKEPGTIDEIFALLEDRAVEFYATHLSKKGPTRCLQLAYDLVHAPGYLLYHFERNHAGLGFPQFFLNHLDVFHIDAFNRISVAERRLKYFLSLNDGATYNTQCDTAKKIEKILFIEDYVLAFSKIYQVSDGQPQTSRP